MTNSPNFTPQATFRWGKYVFAYDCLRPAWPTGCRAPREWCSVAELLERHSESATQIQVSPRQLLPEYRFDYRGNEPHYQAGMMHAQEIPDRYILKIPHGRAFGRYGVVHVPSADVSLTEFDYGSYSLATLRRLLPGGRWNPKYWKHAAMWLWQRKSLPAVTRCPGKVVVLNVPGSQNFFHWTCEVLPRLWSFLQSGERADWYLVDKCSGFQREMLQALGIPLDRVIQPHSTIHLEADKLLIPSKLFPNPAPDMGARIAAALGVEKVRATPPRVFINRRTSRRAANETAFAAWRRSVGFVDHYLEDLPLVQQIALFCRAEVVLGMHGAGLTHLIHCQPGTRVVELMPAGRLQHCYPMLSRLMGLQHTMISVPRAGWGQDMLVPLAILDELATGWDKDTGSGKQAA